VTDKNVFDRLKARGEEMLTQVSAELMQNERFVKAIQSALKGKQALDQAAGRALKQMNIPTRSEFKKAVARIESLERELSDLKAKPSARPAARKSARKARAE
jgi:polyhydroxyalkanoate synthesis regulator phasin